MADEIKNEAVASTKKIRRGISNETKAVSQLRFHEKDAAQNGLFIGHLEEVKVDWAVAKENTSFAGLKMPYLTFHFASQHPKSEEQRHYYHTIFPVESNVATIPGGTDEWRVNSLFAFIKHMLDVLYLRGRQLTEAEEEALTFPFCDFDEEGNYVMVEPQEVLNGYGAIFANVVAMFNGTFATNDTEATGKPCYKDANGKPIALWMKLLRHKKTKKGWVNAGQNGELAFDSFIGSGCIELFKGNGTLPNILRIDPSKESITPKETKKEPTLGGQGMPGMMGGAVMAGGMPTGMPMDNTAFAEAGATDMPF